MFYLKTKIYAPEGSSPQEANINLPEEKKVQYGNEKKEDWRKNLGIMREIDINVVHQYSHLGGKLLHLIYDALDDNMTSTLQVCDGCARSKTKERAFRNKTYKRASNPRENIFVDTTGL